MAREKGTVYLREIGERREPSTVRVRRKISHSRRSPSLDALLSIPLGLGDSSRARISTV